MAKFPESPLPSKPCCGNRPHPDAIINWPPLTGLLAARIEGRSRGSLNRQNGRSAVLPGAGSAPPVVNKVNGNLMFSGHVSFVIHKPVTAAAADLPRSARCGRRRLGSIYERARATLSGASIAAPSWRPKRPRQRPRRYTGSFILFPYSN